MFCINPIKNIWIYIEINLGTGEYIIYYIYYLICNICNWLQKCILYSSVQLSFGFTVWFVMARKICRKLFQDLIYASNESESNFVSDTRSKTPPPRESTREMSNFYQREFVCVGSVGWITKCQNDETKDCMTTYHI